MRGRGLITLGLLAVLLAASGAGSAARGVESAVRSAVAAPATADENGDGVFDDLEARLGRLSTADTFGVLVATSDPASAKRVADLSRRVGGFSTIRRFGLVDGFAATVTKAQAEALAQAPGVDNVELDATVRATDDDSARKWFGVTKATVDDPALDGDADGNPNVYSPGDMVAAVIDTGIDTGHVDLDGGKVLAFKDFVNQQTVPYDDNGHGTHVAGTLAGDGDGRVDHLYRGVAPGAALVAVKALDSHAVGTLSTIVQALNWVVDNKSTYGIEVVNLSLDAGGCADGSDMASQAVAAAVAAGLVVTVAAGNDGPGVCTIGSPAAAPSALTVGAMSTPSFGGFTLLPSSGRGPTAGGQIKPDILGPGYRMTAPEVGTSNGYVERNGTSEASAFVAGVALLLREASPSLTPQQVKTAITSTAVDWGPNGLDNESGAGRLDAYLALKNVGAPLTTGPAVPTHLFFSGISFGPGTNSDFTFDVTDLSYPVTATLTTLGLNAGSGEVPDLDVCLYDPDGLRIACSDRADRAETAGIASPTKVGTYTVRVRGVVGGGTFAVDVSAGVGTIAPAVPAAPAVTVTPGPGAVTLTWPKPAAGSKPITGYKVYRGTASGNEALLFTLGPFTGFTDSAVTNGSTYWYQVSAVNTVGEGPRSTELSATPDVPLPGASVPGAPTLATLSPGDHHVGLSWSAPASDGGAAITGYRIWRGNGGAGKTLLTTVGLVTSFDDTSALNDTTYAYQVSAVNRAGEGARSGELSASPSEPPSVPRAPKLLSASPGDGTVALSWTPPLYDGGSPTTAFRVYRSTPGIGAVMVYDGGGTSFTDGVVNGRTFTYTVTAVNAAGEGLVSSALSATPVATAPQFEPYAVHPVGDSPLEAIATGDVTGDGRTDVVVTTGSNGAPASDFKLWVFAQTAGGTLAAPVPYATGASAAHHAKSIAVGDVTGDGKDDVVLGLDGLGVQVFPQVAAALGPPATTPTTDSYRIRLAHLDGDADLDVVGVGFQSDAASVLLNDGTGVFAAPVVYPVQHDGNEDLAAADVTGDGLDDIVVMSGAGTAPDVSVLSQLAGGGFAAAVGYSAGASVFTKGIAVADVTGDGLNDVVASYGDNAGHVAVLAQTPAGTLDAPVDHASYDFPESVAAGDLDADHHDDVVTLHKYSAGVYRQDGGTLAAEARYLVPASTHESSMLALGDVDGDGVPDIVEASTWDGLVVLINKVELPDPPQAPTLDPVQRGDGTASLSWSPPADDGGAPVTGYNVYRGTSSGGETLLTPLTNVTTFTDTGLTNGTTYWYQVSAVNSAGEGDRSSERSVTPCTVPGPPTLVSATGGNHKVDLVLSPPASTGGAAISSYKIYRGVGAQAKTLLDEVNLPGPTYAYTDTTAENGTQYTYDVTASNLVGEGAYSNEKTAVPAAPPSPPTLAAPTTTATSVSLTWSAPTSDGGAAIAGYNVYRGSASNGETLLTTLENVTAYTDMSVAAGTAYFYEITALNTGGESLRSNERRAVTAQVPGPPTLNSATGGNANVVLAWSAPASNGGAPVTGYVVYRSTSAGAETLLATPGNVTAYTDSTAANGTTYFYAVSAINLAGEGGLSNERSATPITVPGAVVLNTATFGNHSVALAWTAPSSNGGSAITGYTVYRSTSSGTETLLTTLPDQTTFTDTGLTNGITYFYKVRAKNVVGEGAFSNELSATPATVPGAPTLSFALAGNASVSLVWGAPSANGGAAVTSYKIYRGTSSGTETLLDTTESPIAYTDSTAANGTTYFYVVSAVNAAGEGPKSNERSARITVPGAPALAPAVAGDDSVALSWAPPASDGGDPISGYKVYRSTPSTAEAPLTTLGNVTSYTDPTAVNGTFYTYRVTAVNVNGEGAKSAGATAIPAAFAFPAPAWWNGSCDATRWNPLASAAAWTGAGAHALGAVYLGVPVCGPRPGADAAPAIPWAHAAPAVPEWDARELAFRFMAQAYGVRPYAANAEDVVRAYTVADGGVLQTIANGVPGLTPGPGDVISFDSPTSTGNVAVVAWSGVDGSGNGQLVALSQNDTATGWRTLTVTGWTVQGFGDATPYGWLHDPSGRALAEPEVSTGTSRVEPDPPAPTGPRPTVPDFTPPVGSPRPPVVHVG